MTRFDPLLRNPHLATIAANFWPRRLNERRYPVEARLFAPEPEVRVLVHIQRPRQEPLGEVILVHGLEGSSNAGYMRSLAQALLTAGYVVHRYNIRTCGGTEFMCTTLYHAGLTSDLFAYLMDLDKQRRTPVFLVGFSLGGNTVLKLAGELGEDGHRVLAGAASVSAPIDLKACSLALQARRNHFYEWWFLKSMRARLKLRQRLLSDRIDLSGVDKIRTVYELDDRITGPSFGFQGAEHYYQTQSAQQFLGRIRVPALLVEAQDDPLIPFEVYRHPDLEANRNLTLVAPEHGGHMGFLARRRPRFWVDSLLRAWIESLGNIS